MPKKKEKKVENKVDKVVGIFPKPNCQDTTAYAIMESGGIFKIHIEGETATWTNLKRK